MNQGDDCAGPGRPARPRPPGNAAVCSGRPRPPGSGQNTEPLPPGLMPACPQRLRQAGVRPSGEERCLETWAGSAADPALPYHGRPGAVTG